MLIIYIIISHMKASSLYTSLGQPTEQKGILFVKYLYLCLLSSSSSSLENQDCSIGLTLQGIETLSLSFVFMTCTTIHVFFSQLFTIDQIGIYTLKNNTQLHSESISIVLSRTTCTNQSINQF
jgi:hypothetical protein